MNIIVLSKSEFRHFSHLEPYAVIEYRCTNTKYCQPKNDPNELYHVGLLVDDIDGPIEGLHLFDDRDADLIKNFIDLVKEKIKLIVCVCDAGRSRSAGTACALDLYFNQNDRFTKSPKYNPNIHIKIKLLKKLEEVEKEIENDNV